MKTIFLSQTYSAIVDDDVFDEVKKHAWHALKCKGDLVYAQGRPITKSKKHLMHRYIMHLKGFTTAEYCGQDINHKNGNGLDNRLENLELISHALNVRKGNWTPGTSGHKGVFWLEANKKWRAHCSLRRKFIHIGLFDTIEQAIEARQIYLNTHKTNSL